MSLAFLDYLECKEINQAFIRRKMAFVLSSDCRNLLWSNGAAAYFFGFSSVTAMMKERSFFDKVEHHKILKGAQYASAVALDGLKRTAEFSIVSIDIMGIGKAFLLESFLAEEVSLIAGLDDAAMSVTVVDEHGKVLETSSHFSFIDETVKILLQTIDNETPVKTILTIAGIRTQVGIIRLKMKPVSFLVLYAPLKSDELKNNQELFYFTPKLLPQRFTWKMDRNGRFCDVSKELAKIVGPISSSILGSSFHELADQFNDERYRLLNGFIAAALPWSKKIVNWPVDDCLEWLEVELSAVPIFDVKQQLKGFRGFGILKIQEKKQEKKDENPYIKTSSLSEVERLAFHEIAERLRGELHSSVGNKHLVKEAAFLLPNAQTLPVNAIEQTLIKEPAVVLSLLDTATSGIFWLNGEGVIQAVSSAALALTGYEINELLEQPLSSLFTLQSRFLVEKYFKFIRVKGKNQVFNRGETVELLTKSHKNIMVSMTIVSLVRKDDYAVILRDMKETIQSVDKKAEGSKLVGVVHEMRTPLNALIGFAEIMRDGRFGAINNERYRGYLRDIVSSGKHILSLVNQLLECSKANYSGSNDQVKVPLMTEAFDVIACLRASMAFLETQANHNGIIMRIVAPAHVPFIAISQQIFRQIIWNLLSNAIRFTPSGGQIIVHVSYEKKERIKISVSDNGIGMSDEEILQALQPYGQIKRKDGRSGDSAFIGTGLGLPMCKAMIEESGGQLLLFSKPNHGTTVEMFFPHVP
ncbi:PAS domain-containing protein [Bartonella alsatica]|uniref:histidine kinase n=2 Tax=Bartonella alsatica TaxID=52764 RepID=J0PYP2_9HYPH|nr:ATP-binding protein [Bartonella alsatica]EJF75354.1 PAS domain S-box protein [Bartonella alsatica IBS 382]QLC52289.1 PAS domain-containing protein [Bartonella alsatica]